MKNLANEGAIDAAVKAIDGLDSKSDVMAAIYRCSYRDDIETEILQRAELDGEIYYAEDYRNMRAEMQAEVDAARAARDDFILDCERLYDAIAEGRRDDAIRLLGELTNQQFRTVAEQRNLFGDRIPA